jgi:hypothetical protein
LGSETGFPLWGEEKARIRAFFFFRALFSLPCRAREREKSAGAHLWFKIDEAVENFKTLSGSSILALSNHTTFSQTETGAPVP